MGPGREASGSVPDFNPRSHKGSDDKFWRVETVRKNFNPRSHKGSDKGDVSVVLPAGDFNPRSHKGSDRSWPASRRGSETNFNPRSHKGSDRYLSISVRAREFQSTLPQGERRESGSQMCLVHRDFNPRSHKGSDGNPEARCAWCIGISIHAPTRGATVLTGLSRSGILFQSTLPQGERRHFHPPGTGILADFNPRSHKGSVD